MMKPNRHPQVLLLKVLMIGLLLAHEPAGALANGENTLAQVRQEVSPQARAEEILQATITASGGEDIFRAMTNFTIKTQSEITGLAKIALTVTETIQLPDKTKQIMELANGTRVQVLNGSQSWKQINNEVSALSAKEKREMERGLFRDLFNVFKNYDSGEYRVSYIGEETLSGQTNHVVEIKNLTGDFFAIYVDAQTHLVNRKTYLGAPEVGLATMAETYSDYRKIEGVMVPHKIVVTVNEKKFTESSVLETELNSDLSQTFFLND